MERLLDYKWKAKNLRESYLIKRGCKYLERDGKYIYSFTIDKWKDCSVLYGRITIDNETGNVDLNCYTEDGAFFSQFYNPDNRGYEEYLNKINEAFQKKFELLGIYQKKRKKK